MRLPVPMSMVIVTMSTMPVHFLHRRAPILAAECHVHQTEHIEGGDERGNHADQPIHPACVIGLPKYLVLGPEASQRRNSRNRERGNPHRRKRPRHVNAQAAHLAHVLLAADAVNYRTSSEEEQPFEE